MAARAPPVLTPSPPTFPQSRLTLAAEQTAAPAATAEASTERTAAAEAEAPADKSA